MRRRPAPRVVMCSANRWRHHSQMLGYLPQQTRSIGFTGATGNDYVKLEILDFAFTPCP